MNKECQTQLSLVARDYLAVFYCILDQMIKEMTSAKLTDSISHNFIVQMIPHHQAAIDMSRNLLRYTTCVPLQTIAEGIVTEQTKSIENMLSIEEGCSCLQNCSRDLILYQRRVSRIMDAMFSDMGSAPMTNDINAAFMREMIPPSQRGYRHVEKRPAVRYLPGAEADPGGHHHQPGKRRPPDAAAASGHGAVKGTGRSHIPNTSLIYLHQ